MQAEPPAESACPQCGSVPEPKKDPTRCQMKVIERLAQGDDLNEAANSLNVSRKTVEKHVQSAKERLGARTLTGLVVAAIKRGLITI